MSHICQECGMYSGAEARREVCHCGEKVREHICPNALSALRAENERLAWENKSFRISAAPAYADMDVLRSRVARLAEALKGIRDIRGGREEASFDDVFDAEAIAIAALREMEGGAR